MELLHVKSKVSGIYMKFVPIHNATYTFYQTVSREIEIKVNEHIFELPKHAIRTNLD